MIFEEMLKEERAEGFAKGCEEGLQEGRSTLKETLLLFLQKFGDVPDEVLEQIQTQQDMEVDVYKRQIGSWNVWGNTTSFVCSNSQFG